MPSRGRRVLLLGAPTGLRLAARVALRGERFLIAGEGSIAEARRLVRACRADVVVITTPRPMDVSATIRALTADAGAPPVVVLSSSEALYDVVSAARAGAMGYLPTRMGEAGLGRALECVISGEVVIPRALLTLLRDELRMHGIAGLPGGDDTDTVLTRREREVLDLLRAGLSTQEISRHLVIAPVTVRTHVSSIVRKLGVSNRESAATINL